MAQQNGLGPEMWAMTLKQLRNHIVPHPKFNKNKGGQGCARFADTGMSMRDVVKDIVIPETYGKGVGFALMVNAASPLKVKKMVSHAWDEDYEDFIDALERFEHEGPYWVCAMAIYQNDDEKLGLTIQQQVGDDPWEGPFATVLKHSESMVAVLTYTANIYTRMWCVFEMYVAMKLEVPVDVSYHCFDERGMSGNINNALVDFSQTAVDTRTARCGNPMNPPNKDELRIREYIEAMEGSYKAIDLTVEKMRFEQLKKIKCIPPYCLKLGARQDYHDRFQKAFRETAKRIDSDEPVPTLEGAPRKPGIAGLFG